MAIIDDLLESVDKNKEADSELRQICRRMKDQLPTDELVDFLDQPEILYYKKFHEDDFFKKYLVLGQDLLSEEDHMLWVCENNISLETFKKTHNRVIRMRKARDIILEYVKTLKRIGG